MSFDDTQRLLRLGEIAREADELTKANEDDARQSALLKKAVDDRIAIRKARLEELKREFDLLQARA